MSSSFEHQHGKIRWLGGKRAWLISGFFVLSAILFSAGYYFYNKTNTTVPSGPEEKEHPTSDTNAEDRTSMALLSEAIKKEDYAHAFHMAQKLAALNNHNAQAILASLYRNGDGVKKDPKQALYWFDKSANAGVSYAQYNLSRMYELGEAESAPDYKKSFYWLSKSAKSGEGKYEFWLGKHYMYGIGTEMDSTKAAHWYEMAAGHGYVVAQYAMYQLYRSGTGVSKDHKKSIFWLQKASANGYGKAQNDLGALYDNGTGVKQDLVKALSLYHSAANQQVPIAYYNLANMYEVGRGVDKNRRTATTYLELSARSGYSGAMFELGKACLFGRPGIPVNYKMAAEWFFKAAEELNPEAMGQLGILYFQGNGVEKNMIESYKWFNLASAYGDKAAEELRDMQQKIMSHEDVAVSQRNSQEWMDSHKINHTPPEF